MARIGTRLAGGFRSVCFALAAGLALPAAAQVTPGSSILNQASLTAGGVQLSRAAVTVRVSSNITFLKYSPAGGGVATLLNPESCNGHTLNQPAFQDAVSGSLASLPASYPLAAATQYLVGEPVFFEVDDTSRNLDPAVLDTLDVVLADAATGDQETVTLRETSANSGQFIGYLDTTAAAAASGDCQLSVQRGDTVVASYANEVSAQVQLVDPYGVVFDSTSGTRLNGVRVRIVDAATLQPAAVQGDDGAPYPNSIITGSTITVGSLTYSFAPGEFRFPLVAAGRSYRLLVDQLPPGYAAPTALPDSAFATVPGGPYQVGAGSRQDDFLVPSGPPVRVDIPLDAVSSGLFVVKSAGQSIAAVGDFVPYNVQVTNTQASAFTAVHVHDRLPPGFRYRAGTLRFDGLKQPDPVVGSNGRDIDVTLGTVAANAAVRVSYITEVTAAARPGQAENLAEAVSGGTHSNQARATVTVREDLMRSRALLAGRVLSAESCAAADIARARPVDGARIYMEDGRYVITDTRGRWHFDDIRPGSHVVQLDNNGLPVGAEILACDRNTRSAGSSFSRFVDVQGGTLWQVDFYVRLAHPLHYAMQQTEQQVGLRLGSAVAGGTAHFTLRIGNTGTDLGPTRLQLELPAALHYVAGSFKVNGKARADQDGAFILDGLPAQAAGNDVSFDVRHAAGRKIDMIARLVQLGELVKNNDGNVVTWDMILDPAARVGTHPVRVRVHTTINGGDVDLETVENKVAVVKQETLGRVIIFRPHFKSFSTDLSAADMRWLDNIITQLGDGDLRIDVVGHTDNQRVVPRRGRAINDNYALSAARAVAVVAYLRGKMDLPADRINAFGKGPDEPIADNRTAQGREANRRVELKVYSAPREEPPTLEIKAGDSGEQFRRWSEWSAVQVHDGTAAAVNGADAGAAAGAATPTDEQAAAVPVDNGIGILSHHDGETVANRIQAVRVRLDSRLKADIRLDGRPIPEDRLGFTKNEGRTTLMSYVGVDFGEPGTHELSLKASDPFGNVRTSQVMKITVAGEITRLRAAQNPDNVADGRTPIQLKIELVDGSGRVVPVAVALTLMGGELHPLLTSDAQRALTDSSGKIPVSADGIVKFAPVTRSGLYTVELAYNNIVEKIPVYVHPEKRDWILVGLADGTLAHKTISGNMQSAQDAGVKDQLLQDGRVAFFAKGQIQGKWLLTLAYDTNRDKAATFGGAINPEQYYTLYADASDPRFDAPSKEKLYLRIERDAFYALFGDYDTGMTVTELSRYSRTMTGLKSEYHDDRFDLNVFAADTSQGFVRDDQRGNGTSGIYKLRSGQILAGSDKVRIEVRDRLKSDVVLSSQQLSRYADYNIDYDRGEIFFKSPIPSQDDNLNPVWIVAEYEVPTAAGQALNAGGRAAVKFLDGRAVVGVSAVQQKSGLDTGNLQGLDAEYRVDAADVVRAEVAGTSTSDVTLGSSSGNASLLEWKRDSARLKGRVYYRELQGGFGLGQLSATENGTRKIGVEGRYQLQHDLFFTSDVSQQDMVDTGAHREVADLRGEFARDAYAWNAGVRHVQESLGGGLADTMTDQLALGGRYNILDNRVKLRADAEVGVNGASKSQDFPDRVLVGADYQLRRDLQLTAEQEFTWSSSLDTQTSRLGAKYQPWKGANISTNLDQETGEAGDRLRSGLGLGQRLVLTPEWNMDFGYDRADTLKNRQAPSFNPQLPSVFGPATTSPTATDDYWAANVGANYQSSDIKGLSRIERREATTVNQWNVVGGIYRELNPEMAIAGGLTATLADEQGGAIDNRVLLRWSLAWRPDRIGWMLLNRIDYGLDRQVTPGSSALEGHRLVNNLNANRRWDDNQLSLQYGAKLVFSTIDSQRVSGYTDLIGVEWRHDFTERWDFGWQSSMLHSWVPGVLDYSYGVSMGMTPMPNAWVSLGYNFKGIKDSDFSGAEYMAQGIFLKLRLKVDQQSLKQIWSDARGAFH